MPPVFLMPEPGINAFAAGTTVSNAVYRVTQGRTCAFDRDQMQGVIAHEFSHIINGDMRLNLRLMGVIHGIMYSAISAISFAKFVLFTAQQFSTKPVAAYRHCADYCRFYRYFFW